ncbi:MAG TPA: RICIN domain-containing protein [Acidimicrobiales bacterium]|nr:RICIN domain-containing protein [Acidimicrobiales bacterium]
MQIANIGIPTCMTTLGYPQGYDVYQYDPCQGSANQTFDFLNTSTAYYYQIQSQASNNEGCIDNYGNTGNNDAVQVFEPCVGAGNEIYLAYSAGISGEPNEAYLIDSQGLCLTSSGNANDPVEQYTCYNGDNNQIWNIVPYP